MTTPETERALEVARQLARDGIPVFIAPPCPEHVNKCGFALPPHWEQTQPDPAVLDAWQPGWAVCAVMGCGLDLVDLDYYANSAAPELIKPYMPRIYGHAETASGGAHLFVASTGAHSRNNLMPGVDVKAGAPDGSGRGFAFIAPTVKKSKVTGQPATYSWSQVPDVPAARSSGDTSGQALAQLIEDVRRNGTYTGNGSGPGGAPTPEQFMRRRAWGNYRPDTKENAGDICDLLAREGRNDGVMRLAAALRGQGGWALDDAVAHMYEHVWPLIDQTQGGHGFSRAEFEAVIRAQWRQYPDGVLQALSAAEQHSSSGTWPVPAHGLELTDTYLKDVLEEWGIRGRFLWARGIGWLRWESVVWKPVDQGIVVVAAAEFFRAWYAYCAANGASAEILAKMTTLLTANKARTLTDFVHGHPNVARDAEQFDRYPNALNTPGGIVDLRTGEVFPTDPRWMFTKITSGRYVPGYRHPDWDKALTALDAPERKWYQRRVGQAVTGHPPTDGIMPVLQGSGMNGKTAVTTDGPVKALGDFADMASHKLITSVKPGASEHSTEMADLRGQRLLIGEELAEGRSLDVTALKRIQDVGRIKARYVHKDNITFDASHSLMVTTNYVPVINETDHGTWRRLALLRFRYTYRTLESSCVRDTDRLADDGLKHRIRQNESGQHDAIVTWAVEGAMEWFADNNRELAPTKRIEADTADWRKAADRILGFAAEMLEPDPESCILADDMRDQFNAWLARNGHAEWPKETFAGRFAAHEWTTSHGIESRRTAALGGLVEWPVLQRSQSEKVPVKQRTVWIRVRPRNRADQGQWGSAAQVAEVPANVLALPHIGEFTETSATPATAPDVAHAVTPPAPEPPKPSLSVEPAVPPQAGFPGVVLDLETADGEQLFTYEPHDETGYVRLAGISQGGAETIVPGDRAAEILMSAATITGHNVLGFDLLALAWHHGADYDRLAAKAADTEILMRQFDPPRSRESGSSADRYGLDEVAERLGVRGKTDDLARLKRRHKGYDKIPLDDPEYRAYLEGDLAATAAVAARLPRDPYTDREHVLAALAGRMTLNGFRVDEPLLRRRIRAGEDRKAGALRLLSEAWGLPLGSAKSPLATDAGRSWLEGIFERFGAPVKRTGKAGKIATGAEDLKAVAEDPRCPDELRTIITLIGVVVGTRTVYQTAADCLARDGRVHPRVSMRQASGRWSVTSPGLTVFGKRGGRHVEREIFLPDEDCVLVSFDLAQVDMRAMAGHCQDPAYMAMFAPGQDAHQMIASQVGLTRQGAKAVGHGWNYGLGRDRMIRNGLDPKMVDQFIAGMEARFPVLIGWREQIRQIGAAGEILDNGFGRRMRCEPSRAYTVAPALMGQGGARDIMCQCLLRLPREIWPMLRVMVHDEIVLSVPKKDAREVAETVNRAMTWQWAPPGASRTVPIFADMNAGLNWGECSKK